MFSMAPRAYLVNHPQLEQLEPRFLLSAVSNTEALGNDRLQTIQDSVYDVASDVARMKSLDANADASVLSRAGYCTINSEGEMRVKVIFDPEQADVKASLQAAGFQDTAFLQTYGLASGWASYESFEAIAAVTGVNAVALASPPIANVTSAGDGILHASNLRNASGLTGDGINVGVISDGIMNLAFSQFYEELPSLTVDESYPGSPFKDEGTAMLEIVHDLAPGASLFFSGPQDNIEMLQSIIDLVEAGCDVIVDDLAFPADEPFFQDNILYSVASFAAMATQGTLVEGYDPVVYVTSAGNWADKHYQGFFTPDENDFQVFDEYLPNPGFLEFILPPDTTNGQNPPEAIAWLQWSEPWGVAGNDYIVWPYVKENGVYVKRGACVQMNDGTPRSYAVTGNGSASEYLQCAWAIERLNSEAPACELELYTMGANIYWCPGDSIFGQGAVDGVITVGATDAGNEEHDEVEPYSSWGPSTLYTFGETPVRYQVQSLDVLAVDGVQTFVGQLSPGNPDSVGDPFYGTSAAAPHVAAIAALILEWADINDYTFVVDEQEVSRPEGVANFLTEHAVDLTAYGDDYDDASGWGLVDALAIFTSVAPTSVTLAAGSDTGASQADGITKRDNSESGKELEFVVDGVSPGATVRVYADDVEIGWAVVEEGHTSVSVFTDYTDGAWDDGTYAITSTQAEVGLYESAATSGLTITVDTVAPTVQAFDRFYQGDDWDLYPTTLDTIVVTFSEGVYDTFEGDSLTLYNLSTSQAVSPDPGPDFSYNGQTKAATWDFGELDLTENAGWYLVTISGATWTDIAGNAMGNNYTYGAAYPQEKMLIPLLGDTDLSGTVDGTDYTIQGDHWLQYGNWREGDCDYNGFVDGTDFSILGDHWLESLTRYSN